jgi:hypothetical protein
MTEATRKKIEIRAYEIYLNRGKTIGDAKSDWDRAEKEILAELNPPKKTIAKDIPVIKAAPAPVVAKPVTKKTVEVKKPQPKKKK